MTADELTRFRALLVSGVTDADRRESAREEKARVRVNIYRLGHYLKAVGDVIDLIKTGAEPAAAFAKHFAPTARMHRVARKLNLPLDVKRGNWVRLAAPPA